MSEKRKTSVMGWTILGCAACLLGFSVWIMPQSFVCGGSRTWMPMKPLYAIRQGITGVVALALAFGIWRWLPVRRVLPRLGWVPLALCVVAVFAAPLSLWAGWGFPVSGTYWWQRSPGLLIVYAAMVGGLSLALPRFAQAARHGWPAFLGVLAFSVLVPLVVLQRLSELFILFGMAGLCLLCTASGRRLRAGIGMMGAAFISTSFALIWLRPTLIERFCYPTLGEAAYQLQQALYAVHCGGLMGDRYHLARIPEAHTDFIFSSICGNGGLALGIPVLALVGTVLCMAWRIAGKQINLEARACAAGCAALLTLRSLLHASMNLGLWPAMPVALPFMSYGPLLLVFDGGLIGLLLALDRERGTSENITPSRWPTRISLAGVGLLVGLFLVRMFVLVYASPSLAEKREWQVHGIEKRLLEREEPVRGRILDVNGRVLAQHGERYYVCADPQVLAESPDRHLHADLLRLIGLDAEEFARRTLDTDRRYARLATVPKTTAEAVRRMNIRGIFIDIQPSRDYPQETPLTHLAGFVNYEMVGSSGVEQSRNTRLTAGQDVRMTIDVELQQAVQAIAEYHAAPELRTVGRGAPQWERSAGAVNPLGVVDEPGRESSRLVTPAVLPEVESAHARAVQIVLMNPRTGAILAAAQVPATHGADFPSADPRARTWRSSMELFEPGGLVQPLVIASAIELGIVDTNRLVNTENGLWTYHGVPMRDPHPFAEMSPADILIRGANIGMAKIGIEMGTNALHEALVRWGLNTPAVTCAPGSETGILYSPTRWSDVEISRLPIGHGLGCTLMQLARAYTAFWNDGRMVEPYLVEDSPRRDANAMLVPVSGSSAAQVRDMLVRVVEEGTATDARIEGATVFGKTAVVQKAILGSYADDRFETAFIGGFEREGGDPVLIAVWLDEADSEGAGHPAAAVFHEVAGRLTGAAGL